MCWIFKSRLDTSETDFIDLFLGKMGAKLLKAAD